jgi:hypothetical protein
VSCLQWTEWRQLAHSTGVHKDTVGARVGRAGGLGRGRDDSVGASRRAADRVLLAALEAAGLAANEKLPTETSLRTAQDARRDALGWSPHRPLLENGKQPLTRGFRRPSLG